MFQSFWRKKFKNLIFDFEAIEKTNIFLSDQITREDYISF